MNERGIIIKAIEKWGNERVRKLERLRKRMEE